MQTTAMLLTFWKVVLGVVGFAALIYLVVFAIKEDTKD